MREDAPGDDREPPAFRPRPAFDFDAIKTLVQRFFKVYESEKDVRGFAGQEIAAFYVQVTDQAQFAARFDELRAELRSVDPTLMVVLQYSGGEDIILVAKKPPVFERSSALNIFLFIATILTTTLAGSIFYSGYEQVEGLHHWFGIDVTYFDPRFLALGFLSFSLPVMAILGIHELGHFFVAKRHHVRTSLPYFIPVPPMLPIGTFGAFISIREPIPDRKALFDIGASGPIAGFIATIPVLIIGLLLTGAVAAPVPPEDEVHLELVAPDGTLYGDGHSVKNVTLANRTEEKGTRDDYHESVAVNSSSPGYSAGNWTLRVRATHLGDPTRVHVEFRWTMSAVNDSAFLSTGTRSADLELAFTNATAVLNATVADNVTAVEATMLWKMPPKNVMNLGNSLLFIAAGELIQTPPNVLIHPTGFAGWVGLLVTGFNLLPAGQLDGGHVARAALGNHQRWASFASLGIMLVLSWFFAGWLVMALLLTFLGLRHPPPLNDKVPLDGRRKLLAVVVLVILIVCFIPVPFQP